MKEVCKNYKPEIAFCPKCNRKLVYRYPISDKVVQFSNGKKIRIKNLAYGCPSCRWVFVSQTANKLSLKGYTYSTKIACMVDDYKKKHWSRETICDFFAGKNIEISDRNIDMLYHKMQKLLALDGAVTIPSAYQKMIDRFSTIRLAVDLISLEERRYVLVYDFFTADLLAIRCFWTLDDPDLKVFLERFLKKDLPISMIVSIRKDAQLVPLMRQLCPPTTKFLSFNKF